MFTDRSLKSLKPKKKPYRVYEKGPLPGFCVQVTPKGVKTFALHFTLDGRRQFMALGRYPDISLQEARERARAAREGVDRGTSPKVGVAPRDAAKQRTGTVRDAVELYLEDMQARGRSSWKQVGDSLRLHALPEIGDLLARDVQPAHIQRLLAKVIGRGVRLEHNAVRRRLHAVFGFALNYDYDPRAVLRGIRFDLRFNPVSSVPLDRARQGTKDRALTFDEIKAVWNFDGWHALPHSALKMILALGGLRPTEVLGMTKQEVDLENAVFTVPPERFKTRKHHVVPFCSMAREIFDNPPVPELSSDWLFPALRPDNTLEFYRVASLGQYLAREYRNGNWPKDVARFTPYDLRRTFKTRAGEMGIDKVLRDRIQGHAMSDVSSRHYDRWTYLPEKRAALEQWDRRLRETVTSQG